MKRIFTLLVLCLALYQAQAQTTPIFSHDFQSGLAPMTAVDVDGKTLDPNVATFAGPTWKVVGTVNKLAVSTSWFAPPSTADDWLISPAITVTDTNTFLFWESYSPDASYRDGYQVRVSTTDNQVASFTDIALTIPAEETTTKKRALSLDAYIGQTIHFAFRNNSVDKYLLYIDNISVQVIPKRDFVVKGVSFEKYNPIGTSVPIKVTVENNGAEPINSIVFTWSDGVYDYVDTVENLAIGTRDIFEFTHSIPFELTTTGEFPISVSLEKPNGADDIDSTDNVGSRTLYGLSEMQPKKVVVEEGTGSWCGWCPRGFVVMEQIGEEYADVAIPIAVHNYDPMLLPDYDTPFSGTIGGYPSGHVDRKELDIDPAHPQTGYGFITAINNLDERMVPGSVDVETLYDPDTRTVQITAKSHLSISTEINTLRFLTVITEDSVTGPSTSDPLTDYDQVNYYANNQNGPMGGFESLPNPVPASQMIYNDVARALIGGYEGMENSIPEVLEADEEFTFEATYVVPANFNPDNMDVIVAMVDYETGEILNANSTDLNTTTSVPLVPVGNSVLYPNPTSDFLNLSVTLQTNDRVNMRIYDTYGRLIRDLGNLDLSTGNAFEKIDVSAIQTGNYILELRHKNSVTALPFTRI